MNSKLFIGLLLIAAVTSGCKKEEIMSPLSETKAKFQIQKEVYDDGETIELVNTSKNAQSFVWIIGDDELITDSNPVLEYNLNGETSKTIPVALEVYGKNGEFNRFESEIKIGSRIFKGFAIHSITNELRGKIAAEDKKRTTLVTCLGPVNEVDGWSPPHHFLPEVDFSKYVKLPFKFESEKTPKIGMNNDEWYLRLSTRLDGQRTPIYLKEFRFNPARAIISNKSKSPLSFILSDEEMTIEVFFSYE